MKSSRRQERAGRRNVGGRIEGERKYRRGNLGEDEEEG